MPAGDIPQRERKVAWSYLVEHSERLNVDKVYGPTSRQPKKKSKKVLVKKEVTVAKETTKVEQSGKKAATSTKDKSKKVKASAKAAGKKQTKPVAKKNAKPAKVGRPSKKVTKKSAAKSSKVVRAKPTAVPLKVLRPLTSPPTAVVSSTTPETHIREEPVAEAVPHVMVMLLNGKRLQVPFGPTLTLSALRLYIQTKEGIPANQQRIIFRGAMLDEKNDVPLVDVGVTNGCPLYLVLRLRPVPL